MPLASDVTLDQIDCINKTILQGDGIHSLVDYQSCSGGHLDEVVVVGARGQRNSCACYQD